MLVAWPWTYQPPEIVENKIQTEQNKAVTQLYHRSKQKTIWVHHWGPYVDLRRKSSKFTRFLILMSSKLLHKYITKYLALFSTINKSDSVSQSVQLLSHVQLFATPWCSTPGLPVHHQLPEPTQTHVHWVGDAIQPSHPLSSPSPPALNLSHIRVFSNESALCIRWPKCWSFSFNVSPSN